MYTDSEDSEDEETPGDSYGQEKKKETEEDKKEEEEDGAADRWSVTKKVSEQWASKEIRKRVGPEHDEDRTIRKIRLEAMGLSFQLQPERRARPDKGVHLESQLSEGELTHFLRAFEKYPTMSIDQLHYFLRRIADLNISDEQMEVLFWKMDTDRNELVGWDEFLSYLLLEIQETEMVDATEDLVLPLQGCPRVVKPKHRFAIVRILFLHVLGPDRSASFLSGRYASICRDGMINYWNLDFELEETKTATPPRQRIQSAWLNDMAHLPDVSIVCTCSTEKELLFYDVSAQKLDLRMMVTHLDSPATTLSYYFPEEAHRESTLVAGDMAGNVIVFRFPSDNRGPFFFTPRSIFTSIKLSTVLRGGLPKMRAKFYTRVHGNWVKQVAYHSPLQSYVSCAVDPSKSMVIGCMRKGVEPRVFSAPRGIHCFAIMFERHTVVTGCGNGAVMLWDPHITTRSSVTLTGHNTPVVVLVLQDHDRLIYSIAKDHSVKVWDTRKHTCIQTYLGMPTEPGGWAISAVYNPVNRYLVLGGANLVVLALGHTVDQQRSDGYTHTMAVVRALYNPLYKCVVTVGLDSMIMVWDPWEGRRKGLVRSAHTRLYYGVPTAVEITAAAFDPAYHLLATGARDGTLKVWNFNMGTCVRTMNIELFCEVTNILWEPGRILVVGWDRRVTEFADGCDAAQSDVKVWETRHTDDVLCMVLRRGQTIATSSYNGELVLWRADTGHAYRRYNVQSPTDRIVMTYTRQAERRAGVSVLTAGTVDSIASLRSQPQPSQYSFRKAAAPPAAQDPVLTQRAPGKSSDVNVTEATARRLSQSLARRRSSTGGLALRARDLLWPQARPSHDDAAAAAASPAVPLSAQARRARRVSTVRLPEAAAAARAVSVSAMVFLQTRPMEPQVGALVVALDKGLVQMWSHHPAGGYLGNFLSIHMAGDYVTAMVTDPEDKYLFTGTAQGYIKIWLLSNYALGGEAPHVSMPALRLQFPFLWRDRVEGRAKRSLRHQPWPLLLSSHRAHLLAILCIQYVPEQRMLITSGADASVRLWCLSGRYIGTLGGIHQWTEFSGWDKEGDTPPDNYYRIPADVKLVMSSTTLKVLSGGNVPHTHFKLLDDSDLLRDLPEHLLRKATYGRRPGSPLLGRYITLQEDEPTEAPPELRTFGREVAAYQQLRTVDVHESRRPRKPPSLVVVHRTERRKRALGSSRRRSPRESSRTSSKASSRASGRRTPQSWLGRGATLPPQSPKRWKRGRTTYEVRGGRLVALPGRPRDGEGEV